MSHKPPELITSLENALVKRVRLMLRDGGAYRKIGLVWLEGDHLCRAAHAAGWRAQTLIWSQDGLDKVTKRLSPAHAAALHALKATAAQEVVFSDKVLRAVTALDSLPTVCGLFAGPAAGAGTSGEVGLHPEEPTVILDRLQDPGNIGSIIRSAAALGFKQLVAMKGSAALWTPKVVRAGMGAHFALRLFEACDVSALAALRVPLLVTSSHGGDWLHEATLPWPCAWVLGHEGQGVSEALMARASQAIRIVQPGGEESFNVAAAAAICLHASAASEAAKKAR